MFVCTCLKTRARFDSSLPKSANPESPPYEFPVGNGEPGRISGKQISRSHLILILFVSAELKTY